MRRNFVEIGKRFGRVVVLADTGKRTSGHKRWLCRCDCGNEKELLATSLKNQKTPSCGCATKERYQNARWGEPGNNSFVYLYNRLKNNARLRGYDCSLHFEDFKTITQQNCFYCNAEPKPYNYYLNNDGNVKRMRTKVAANTVERSWIKANGIDRVENAEGYHINNCVACCEDCNRAKLDNTKDHFLKWLKRVSEHQFGIK